MGYNPNIKLDPKQLGLIEDALRAEASRLTWPSNEQAFECKQSTQAVREINALLGHIHNQKVWYTPKKRVPLG